MKDKVGIITLHKNTNYGANLQAYASNQFIKQLGYECEIIDYAPAKEEKLNHLLSWLYVSWKNNTSRQIIKRLKLLVALILSIPEKFLRLHRFACFRKKYCQLSRPCSEVKDAVSLNYDTVVCGSDQIWNPTITDGVNPIYYGHINGVKKRISFAASIGKKRLDEHDEQKVTQLVKKIDYCSLREEDSAQYIFELSGCSTTCVCDPVFLLDKSDYEKLIKKQIFKEPYVLLYSIVSDKNMLDIAKKYANQNNLRLIEICADKNRHCYHKQLTALGPQEFLSCFKYAEVIFTNSFHGTAFSIIFEKKFHIVDNKQGGTRILNLLDKAGLQERLICVGEQLAQQPIDYRCVHDNLYLYIEKSKHFLSHALAAKVLPTVSGKCVGCGACQKICKMYAINMLPNKEGFLYAVTDQSKCIECGQCTKVCPALNLPLTNEVREVFAFKAENKLREKSASGGAFAAMANFVVGNGGVVWGAVQDENFTVKHQRCSKLSELCKLQGTKYVQSNLEEVYQELEDDLISKKSVLFSGTPCQVEAIKRYVQAKKLPEDNLYLIDIICHGVPSAEMYFAFLNWLVNKKGSIHKYYFRSKKIAWRGNSCLVELKDGTKLKNDKEALSFMNLYYSGYITRESCYSCKYANNVRNSDITIGDYWGIENLNSDFEDELGVSAVLVNTSKGEDLFAMLLGTQIRGNLDTLKQPQLYRGCERPKERSAFWREYESNGINFVLQKYGGMKTKVLKEYLYKLKMKLFKKSNYRRRIGSAK